jgi:hypothetical protein
MTAKEFITEALKRGYIQYGNLYKKVGDGYIHTFVLTGEKVKYTATPNWTYSMDFELSKLAPGNVQDIEESEKHGI